MTLGKSKKFIQILNRRKKVDTFVKKQWFNLKAPSIFPITKIGETVANEAISKYKPEDSLRGRAIEVTYADLNPEKDLKAEWTRPELILASDRVFRFKVPQGGSKVNAITNSECLTLFAGYRVTTHKRKSLAKKKQIMVETFVPLDLCDGYSLRFKVICFTEKQIGLKNREARRPNAYKVKAGIVSRIRAAIGQTLRNTLEGKNATQLMEMISSGDLEAAMKRGASFVKPVRDLLVEKVKVLSIKETEVTEAVRVQHNMGVASN